MDYAALKAELLTDPAGLGYAADLAVGNDSGVADRLNAKTGRGPVPIEEVAAYCCCHGITGGVMAVLEIPIGADITAGVPMTVATKGMLHTVLTLVQLDFRLTTVDTDYPEFLAACDGLVALGVMTAQQKTDLVAMGDGRRSRAEKLWGDGVVVSAFDVGSARNLNAGG